MLFLNWGWQWLWGVAQLFSWRNWELLSGVGLLFPLVFEARSTRSLSPLSSPQSPDSHLPNTVLIYSKLAAVLQTSSLFSCVLLPCHLWNSVVTDASHCLAVVTVCVHIRVCVSMCLCVLIWISGIKFKLLELHRKRFYLLSHPPSPYQQVLTLIFTILSFAFKMSLEYFKIETKSNGAKER